MSYSRNVSFTTQNEKLEQLNSFRVRISPDLKRTHQLCLDFMFPEVGQVRKEEKNLLSTDNVDEDDITADGKHIHLPWHCGKCSLPSLKR